MKMYEFLFVFAFGFLSCVLFSLISYSPNLEFPIGNFNSNQVYTSTDYITEDDILIQKDKIIIYLENPSVSRYADSGSMEPIINGDSNGIRVKPKSEDDIDVGDIVTFNDDGTLIVHRVIDKGVDYKGTYFVTKGDNNDFYDGKIRFEQIKYITVGILY